MEIFTFAEEGEPDDIGYLTDSGKVMTWVPRHKTDKWCVHTHGQTWLDDVYMRNLDDALRRITKPNDQGFSVAEELRKLHGCDPFEDVEDNLEENPRG